MSDNDNDLLYLMIRRLTHEQKRCEVVYLLRPVSTCSGRWKVPTFLFQRKKKEKNKERKRRIVRGSEV